MTKDALNNKLRFSQSSSPFSTFDLSKVNPLGLCKKERLKNERILRDLFQLGTSVSSGPLKVIFSFPTLNSPFPAQVAFSAPKRLFSKAHQRQQLKRHLREAYRANKFNLYQQLIEQNKQLALMIIVTSNKEVDTATFQKTTEELLERILVYNN